MKKTEKKHFDCLMISTQSLVLIVREKKGVYVFFPISTNLWCFTDHPKVEIYRISKQAGIVLVLIDHQ